MVPDAHSASGDASQCTADAISSGRATRWNGLCARIASPRSALRCSLVMSVATKPGATEATAIPYGASATARDWPIELSAAFEAPYAG
jgi:sodium/bile acid cotransporter 7